MGGIRSWLISLAFLLAGGCKENADPGSAAKGSAGSPSVQQGPPPPPPLTAAELPIRLGGCKAANEAPSWISAANPHVDASSSAGWGTIGTGKYGTIGHGAGTGAGYGVGTGPGASGRRMAALPTVSIGQPNATGDLDKAIIRRYIKRNTGKLQYCYEKQLLAKPGIGGTIQARFLISRDGTVSSSEASGIDVEVAKCVADVIASIHFPAPKGGGNVQVNYPFTFRPAGDDTVPKSKTTPWQRADIKKQPARPPDDDDSGGTGTAMALDEGKMGQRDSDRPQGQYKMKSNDVDPQLARQQAIDQAKNAGILGSGQLRQGGAFADVTGVVTGRHDLLPNVLDGHDDQIVQCLRKQAAQRHGVVVVHFEPEGSATPPDVYGIDDKAAASCIADVAKSIKGAEPRTQSLRCGFAFGKLSIDTAYGLDITDKGVSYEGKQLASHDDVKAVQEPKLDAITKIVDARNAKLKDDPKAAVVSLRGPAIVRVHDAAPMSTVEPVMRSLKIGGEYPILAHREGNTWRLAIDEELPAVPLPAGAGGDWHASPMATDPDAEYVTLSIYVQSDKIWVGLSRVNEFQEIPGHDFDKLAETLSQHKRSAYFVDRTDAELAGDGSLTFATIRKVRDILDTAGFRHVGVISPEALSARPML